MSDQDVIERLANKLAAANLDDEEAGLLLSLFQDGRNEVEGFAQRPYGVTDYMEGGDKLVAMPKTSAGCIDVLSTDTGSRAPGNRELDTSGDMSAVAARYSRSWIRRRSLCRDGRGLVGLRHRIRRRVRGGRQGLRGIDAGWRRGRLLSVRVWRLRLG